MFYTFLNPIAVSNEYRKLRTIWNAVLRYDHVNRVYLLPHWGETNKKIFQILELRTNEILSDYFLIGPEPTDHHKFWTLLISHKFEQNCLTFWFMKLQGSYLKRIGGFILFLRSRELFPLRAMLANPRSDTSDFTNLICFKNIMKIEL